MSKEARANLILLCTAIIWGMGFVAQKAGADAVSPFWFNAIRFALGSIALIPLLLYKKVHPNKKAFEDEKPSFKTELIGGLVTGFMIFGGSTCQQIGIEFTTVGNAAFLTAVYIILVPLLGIFFHQKVGLNVWVATIFTAFGLYFLTITDGLSIGRGDLIVFIGSFLWAGHILSVDHYTSIIAPTRLAFLQFTICSLFNLIIALIIEPFSLESIKIGFWALIYSGFISAGIGYTLQLVGQKYAKPTPASLILSLEIVFATIFGYIFFHEVLTARGVLGAVLMFIGIILAQFNGLIPSFKKAK